MKKILISAFIMFCGCSDDNQDPWQERDFYQIFTDELECRWSKKLNSCFCWKSGASYSLTWVPTIVCVQLEQGNQK
jgi:hypothetical protein